MTQKADDEVLLYITGPDRTAALAIARSLLEERLIACANVIDGATSLYWWEGEIDEAQEAVLIAKTTSGHMPSIIARILKLHPYSCPCVVALPIVAGNPSFLRWIREETTLAVKTTPAPAPPAAAGLKRRSGSVH